MYSNLFLFSEAAIKEELVRLLMSLLTDQQVEASIFHYIHNIDNSSNDNINNDNNNDNNINSICRSGDW